MSELDGTRIADWEDLNARLWAWIETVYHRTAHAGLDGQTPLARYQQDLACIRTLGARAAQLDTLFHHRVTRKVRKDGTVSYQGARFEVPYPLSGRSVRLVVDPHTEQVLRVEDDQGNALGAATPLDALANARRPRRRPRACEESTSGGVTTTSSWPTATTTALTRRTSDGAATLWPETRPLGQTAERVVG